MQRPIIKTDISPALLNNRFKQNTALQLRTPLQHHIKHGGINPRINNLNTVCWWLVTFVTVELEASVPRQTQLESCVGETPLFFCRELNPVTLIAQPDSINLMPMLANHKTLFWKSYDLCFVQNSLWCSPIQAKLRFIIQGYHKTNRHFQRYVVSNPFAVVDTQFA
jgi:hypothetical protein